MPALLVRRISLTEANNILRGGVRLPIPMNGQQRLHGLHNLTLVFTAPADTVTFSDASGAGLTLKQFIAAIKTQVPDVDVSIEGQVIFIEDADTSAAVVIDGAASTARPVLGLKNGSISGTLYAAPGGTPPALVSISETGQMDGMVLTTMEA